MAAKAWLQLAKVADTAARAQSEGLGWLTALEQQRLAAMQAAPRRESFIAGHWLARQLAARWLGEASATLTLAAHPDGRPLLLRGGDTLPLSLSLSHSGGWLALALSDAAVGVDIELPQRERNWEALAAFTFSEEESQRVCCAEPAQQRTVFHTLWTLKEARGKRSGEGLLPQAARKVSALVCMPAESEARSWVWQDGALALALAASAQLELVETPQLQTPHYWRYAQAASALD